MNIEEKLSKNKQVLRVFAKWEAKRNRWEKEYDNEHVNLEKVLPNWFHVYEDFKFDVSGVVGFLATGQEDKDLLTSSAYTHTMKLMYDLVAQGKKPFNETI